MSTTISTQDKIKVLAKLMRTHRAGDACKIVFFLGAGAPRATGLPLADDLRRMVLKKIFGNDVPSEIGQNRLEDLMELLYNMGKDNGYELVAEEIRKYRNPPKSYLSLADLIKRDYVEAILTTNFDLLLDNISSFVKLDLTVMASDTDFENNAIPHGSILLGKLHGSARNPSTMRGSWTDVSHSLPDAKKAILENLVGNFLTVFVGYAGRDPDVRDALRSILTKEPKNRIFWVDPITSSDISEILGWFGSSDNQLKTTAENFFKMLHGELFGSDFPDSDTHSVQEAVERIQASDYVSNLQAQQEAKDFRERYRNEVDRCVRVFLRNIKQQEAPNNANWLVTGKAFNITDIEVGDCADAVEHLSCGMTESASLALQIRTGGPALTMFIGNRYAEDGDEISLTALVAYHRKSKKNTGTPLPPLQVWDCSEFTVEWGSGASFGEMETWLRKIVRPLFLKNVNRFAEIVDGRGKF